MKRKEQDWEEKEKEEQEEKRSGGKERGTGERGGVVGERAVGGGEREGVGEEKWGRRSEQRTLNRGHDLHVQVQSKTGFNKTRKICALNSGDLTDLQGPHLPVS